MQRRESMNRSRTASGLALVALLLFPDHAFAHGEELLTVYSWFGVVVLGMLHWGVWTSYHPQTKRPWFCLLATSTACGCAAFYAWRLARDLHYGNPKVSEFGPAVLLIGMSVAGIYRSFRARRSGQGSGRHRNSQTESVQ